jgi:hypothetical protein
MSAMGRVIFDEPAWWQQPQWQLVAAVIATIAALAVWWAALAPADSGPIEPPRAPNMSMAAASPTRAPIERAAPPLPGSASTVAAPPLAQPGLSIMVAPGVHVTPMNVPSGTEPAPAGPREHDSELEN